MSQSTQQKLVAQAQKLLWYNGYEGTSLNDVVARAGLSKGAFFHYYPNKQTIAQEVIDKYAREQLFEPLEKHMAEAASVKEGVRGWIADIFEAYRDNNFHGGCLLGNLALEMSDGNEAAREIIKQHFLELENALVLHFKPLMERGKLELEPRQLARLLIATLQGVTLMSKAHKDNNRASREFQAISQLIDYMIRD